LSLLVFVKVQLFDAGIFQKVTNQLIFFDVYDLKVARPYRAFQISVLIYYPPLKWWAKMYYHGYAICSVCEV